MIHAVALLAKSNWSWLIRAAVVGLTLCLLPVVGFVTTRVPPAFVLLGLILPFGIVVVAKRMEVGLAGMLLAAVFIRFRIPTGTASEIVISLVMCMGYIALWMIDMLVGEKRLFLKPSPANVPLLAFVATVPISWVWGRAFRDVLVHEVGHPLVSVVAGLVMVLLPACLLLVANNIRSVGWLQVVVWVLIVEGLIVLGVDFDPAGALRRIFDATPFVWVNSHGLLSMWCVSFALALALFNRRIPWILRVLLLAYVVGFIYWGFIQRTSWLSGWVPTFVAAMVIAFMRSKKLFIVLVILAVVGAGGYYWRTSFEGESQESGSTRLAAYEVNWRVTGKHLVFGTGPAGYASYYMSYFPTEAMASHNNYIDILAQTGIVGTFFLLWFFGAQVAGGYKLRLDLRGRWDFAESLSVAVLGGTVGCMTAMALGDWLLPFAYTQGIVGFDLAMFNWFFMGSIWALRTGLGLGSTAEKPCDFQGAAV